jgi:uncharacterized protein YggE
MKYSTILFVSLLVIATSAFSATDDVLRTITVTGRAEVLVVPDEAVVNLGVEIFKSELGEAKEENDRIVTAVLAAAKKNGVSTEHLKTDYLHIQPRYRETREERVFLGYIVRQSIIVIVAEVDRLDGIISSALEAGANQVHGVEFRTSEPRKHKDEARSLALDAAKEKAEAMAGRLGQKIRRPITITEESVTRSAPLVSNVTRFSGKGARVVEGTMVGGRIAISARVSVKFELFE